MFCWFVILTRIYTIGQRSLISVLPYRKKSVSYLKIYILFLDAYSKNDARPTTTHLKHHEASPSAPTRCAVYILPTLRRYYTADLRFERARLLHACLICEQLRLSGLELVGVERSGFFQRGELA